MSVGNLFMILASNYLGEEATIGSEWGGLIMNYCCYLSYAAVHIITESHESPLLITDPLHNEWRHQFGPIYRD